MLESIKLLSSSLSQSKHGQKVLSKLQKQYPHVFVGAATTPNKSVAKNNAGSSATDGG